MKDITGQVTVSGTVDNSQSISMGIDGDGIGHIMSVLSNQYSNRTLAVLREYSCNAHDSHVEAKASRPVEISLPSDLNPSLIVQDFGMGLTKDEIVKVFGTYGKSTKRNSNDVVGALGIGSKAAFTMGSQFIVAGVKDGKTATVMFALNDHHVGQMTVLAEGETDGPNGVTVTLPVQDVRAMHQEARIFFATWPKGSVLVDGQEPNFLRESEGVEKVNETAWLIPNDNYTPQVIMGTVAYPLSSSILTKAAETLTGDAASLATSLSSYYSRDRSMVFEVTIGAVNIAPSREALSDTKRTVAAVAAVVKQAADDMLSQARTAVDNAPTWFQASRAREEAIERLTGIGIQGTDLTYKGKPLAKVKTDLVGFALVGKGGRSTKKVVGSPALDVEFDHAPDTDRVMVITGVDTSKWEVAYTDLKGDKQTRVRPTAPRGLKKFLEEYPDAPKQVLLTSNTHGVFDWFTYGPQGEVRTMTLDEFKAALRSLRTSTVRSANEPSYSEGYDWEKDPDDRTPLSELLDAGDPIAYFEGDNAPSPDTFVRNVLKDYTVITLTPTQTENALLKRVPDAVDAWPLIRDAADEAVASLNADDQEILNAAATMHQHGANSLRNWRNRLKGVWSQVTNPVFLAPFKVLADAEELVDLYRDRYDEIQGLNRWARRTMTLTGQAEAVSADIEENWPLLKALSYYGIRDNSKTMVHALAYLNNTTPVEICAECEVNVDECDCDE